MALSKEVTVPATGAVASYWRILSAEAVHTAGAVNVMLGGYVSKAARDEGRDPITSRFFRFAAADYPDGADLHTLSSADHYRAIAAAVAEKPAKAASEHRGRFATQLSDAPEQRDPLAGAEPG